MRFASLRPTRTEQGALFMLRFNALRPLARGALRTRVRALSLTRCALVPAEGTPVNINIIKNGADPIIRPEADYPAWLHTLADRPSLEDLEEELDAAASLEDVPAWKVRLYMQRASKSNIKDNNEAGKGGAF